MMRRLLALALLTLAACGGEKRAEGVVISRDPVSVRGWILDVKGAQRADTMEVEVARRAALFQATSVWVENVDYATGGISEAGSFVVLDVPPLNAVLGFNAPGAETAQVVLEGVPGQADVFIPGLILANGGATVEDPAQIRVRIPSSISKSRATDRTAKVAGYPVRVIETPLAEFHDRRDFPPVPGYRPVATFK